MKWNGENFIAEHPHENWAIEKYDFASSLINSNEDVLDAACGMGYGSFLLAHKAKKVVGMDIDSTIKRVLRPNGKLIFSTPERYVMKRQGIDYGDFHVKELTKKELLDLFKIKGFESEVYGQGRFTEPSALRVFLNFLKKLDFLNLRKLIKPIIVKIDRATSAISFDYKVYKFLSDKDLASHII